MISFLKLSGIAGAFAAIALFGLNPGTELDAAIASKYALDERQSSFARTCKRDLEGTKISFSRKIEQGNSRSDDCACTAYVLGKKIIDKTGFQYLSHKLSSIVTIVDAAKKSRTTGKTDLEQVHAKIAKLTEFRKSNGISDHTAKKLDTSLDDAIDLCRQRQDDRLAEIKKHQNWCRANNDPVLCKKETSKVRL